MFSRYQLFLNLELAFKTYIKKRTFVFPAKERPDIIALFSYSVKAHKAHREELDGTLWLLRKILCLLPELLARRWQCHSLSRIMAKLLHLGNSPWLRKEGVR